MPPRTPKTAPSAPAFTRVAQGDFAAVPVRGAPGFGIALGELADGSRGWSEYRHVLGYAGYYTLPPLEWDRRWIALQGHGNTAPGHYVFEAQPGGARFRRLDGRPEDIPGALWSTGLIKPITGQRVLLADQMPVLQGTPYSAADYFALAAHRLHLARWDSYLQRYVETSKHMICSQLWDYMYTQAGIQLFSDRWPGYVTPWDMAALLLSKLPPVTGKHPALGTPIPAALLARR